MKLWLRTLTIFIMIEGLVSVLWFVLGVTAYFQRGMDLIATAYLGGLAVPMLLLSFLFAYLLSKKWTPRDKEQRMLLYTTCVINMLFSVVLVSSLYTNGWTNTHSERDTLKVTDDQKYEYQIELVNLFQRNSYARLHLRNVQSDARSSIRVDMHSNEIVALGVSNINNWVELKSTTSSEKYILRTTADLGIPEESFIIDVLAENAQSFN
ncbi:hypothetical protein [Paenibacillus wenxiniae]|uniref:Uncharacterized protein n=1 Tax=Paenibacillus wenxiniae TaxID=1636843 RepID=A0ABW4RDU3_9BACL